VTDFDTGLAQAKKEHKDVFLLITGSDWCIWCKRLEGQVLSKKEFLDKVPKDFVLVKLDFPRNKKIPEDQRKRNRAVKEQYGARGFPTVFLLDSDGHVYAKTGYRRGGPEKYVAFLAELRKERVKRSKKLALARKADGIAKAKLLDEAIGGMEPEELMEQYGKVADDIIELDATNAAGLKNKYLVIKGMNDIGELSAKGDIAAALSKADDLQKKYKPIGQMAQNLRFMRSVLFYRSGKKAEAKAELNAALEAAPTGEKVDLIRSVLKRFFGD